MKAAVRRILSTVRQWKEEASLPQAAREQAARDREALPADPGPGAVVAASMQWLADAQDHSATSDGGAARHYDLRTGWGPSYPETSGYIVPTLLEYGQQTGDATWEARASRMLDWLVAIQLPDGAFQGGTIGATPVVGVTFNTGQILLGLAAGATRLGDRYLAPMRRAGDWLAHSLDADGCWRRHPTPFAAPGDKVYETHVSWGLFEAARVDGTRGYAEAALRQVHWALGYQAENGWFAKCCLTEPERPLTHTLGYALRGVLEAYRFSGDPNLLAAASRTADGLLSARRGDGSIPGRLDAGWGAGAPWVCLTGCVQIAHCLLMLHEYTNEAKYLDAARGTNAYVRRTVRLDGPAGIRGGVKGSHPVDGDYGRYQYLNWAAKFLVDASLLERERAA